jgi:hypothetical protein
MDNDKEKSAIDKFKETLSNAVGNLASIVTPSVEMPKKVAATTNEQVYIPETADAAAMPAPLFANRVRNERPQAASSAKRAAKRPVKKQKPNHQPDGKPQRRNDASIRLQTKRKNRSAK